MTRVLGALIAVLFLAACGGGGGGGLDGPALPTQPTQPAPSPPTSPTQPPPRATVVPEARQAPIIPFYRLQEQGLDWWQIGLGISLFPIASDVVSRGDMKAL